MPKKRDVLASFTRDELSEAVERFELTPDDRRVKDQLVEALAASHKATLPAVLEAFSWDRLKELCRTLDLDDGGRGQHPDPSIPKGRHINGFSGGQVATRDSRAVEGSGSGDSSW